VIVDCARYEHGRRQAARLTVADAGTTCRAAGGFVWLGVRDPSAEEFQELAREFSLHELAVEDAVNAHQRPKVEPYGDLLLVVVKTARYVDPEEVVEIGELQIFVHPTFVLTVRHGAGGIGAVRTRLERRPDLLAHGTSAVLYAILDQVVDDYEAAAQGIELDIQQVEQQVFSSERGNPGERIYNLKREVLEFHRAVIPLAAEVDELARDHFDAVPDDMLAYFRDVHDHLLRVGARIEGFRDLLASALQANLTQVSVRQNEDMRKISAWVAILAVPTMIAAIYGMNFEHMPELRWRFGYPTVLVVIALACLVLHRRFKRDGWL
jgi:magnesium transporter